jgi:hypothetical protein
MKEQFIEKEFGHDAQVMIVKINQILSDYAAQGYDLSLRQLYYQFVARDAFPADRTWTWTGSKWVRDPNGTPNAEPNYKWLGDIVSDGRLAGLIDWDLIKDRGREMVQNPHWKDPADFLEVVAPQFRFDLWADQPSYVEVMVEKQALEGVLQPVCRQLDVPFTANKGYSSSSALYEASKRFLARAQEDKHLFVVYLGDHDPSGIDMSRDVEDRLNMFINTSMGFRSSEGDLLQVKRVALNMDQIRKLRPPENPAKLTDSRANSYVRRFGRSSWELDAIEPRALAQLVTDAVTEIMDVPLFEKNRKTMEQGRKKLLSFAKLYRKG